MSKLAGDHVRVLVDGYELTGDHNQITINDSYKILDVTTFGDAVHRFIPGIRQMSLDHKGWMNADAARSHPVLMGSAVNGVISVLVGENADPVVGNIVYALDTQQSKYGIAPQFGEVIPFTATFGNQGKAGGWGVLLAAPTEFTNSSNGSALDNGAATSKGGSAYLHVLETAASDTYDIVVEGSTTGAFSGEETTIADFTLTASALGSERIAISGTIPRYVRWKATRTGAAGDAVRIAAVLIRN